VSVAASMIALATATAYTERFQSCYMVYALSNEKGIFYVGITRNYEARMKAHKQTYGSFTPQILISGISLVEARVYETSLILSLGGSTLVNDRLSISNIRYNSELIKNSQESDILLLLE